MMFLPRHCTRKAFDQDAWEVKQSHSVTCSVRSLACGCMDLSPKCSSEASSKACKGNHETYGNHLEVCIVLPCCPVDPLLVFTYLCSAAPLCTAGEARLCSYQSSRLATNTSKLPRNAL